MAEPEVALETLKHDQTGENQESFTNNGFKEENCGSVNENNDANGKSTPLNTDKVIPDEIDSRLVNNPADDIKQAENGVSSTPKRPGILRNINSEPVIVITNHPPSRLPNSFPAKKVKSRINHLWSSQEFDNPAFDLDENNIEFSPDCKLADIVQQTLRRNSDFGYIHPYGRGNLYTTVFLGEKSKAADSSGGMLAFWVAFIIMVVGLAGAIIFMAEMYRVTDSKTTNNSTVT